MRRTAKEMREQAAALGLSEEEMKQANESIDAIEASEKITGGWGGARPNSGRPALDPEEKASVQVAFRLTPAEKALLLERFGQEGDTVHKVCQRLAREALEGVGR